MTYETIEFSPLQHYVRENSYYRQEFLEETINHWISIPLVVDQSLPLGFSHFGKYFKIIFTIKEILPNASKLQMTIQESLLQSFSTDIQVTPTPSMTKVKPKSLSTQNHIMYLVYTYQTESKLFVKLSTIVENAII